MVTTRMHSKSSIIKSLSEDPLSSSSVANIIDGTAVTARNTDTGNLQGFPSSSSIVVEGHSEITLKNRQHAIASTMSHCLVSELIWKIMSVCGMIVLL